MSKKYLIDEFFGETALSPKLNLKQEVEVLDIDLVKQQYFDS